MSSRSIEIADSPAKRQMPPVRCRKHVAAKAEPPELLRVPQTWPGSAGRRGGCTAPGWPGQDEEESCWMEGTGNVADLLSGGVEAKDLETGIRIHS